MRPRNHIPPISRWIICSAIMVLTSSAVIGCSPPEDVDPMPTAVLFGRVFDSATGETIEDGVVVLTGERITCSGERWTCQWPVDAPQHNYENSTILPGFIDLHAHIRPHFVGAYVPAGVTTVRDVSNTLRTIERGKAHPGAPRIIAAGPELDGPGSFLAPISTSAARPSEISWADGVPVLIENEADALEAVRTLREQGAEWLKLREMLDPEHFGALLSAAREEGLRSTADIGLLVTGGMRGPRVDITEAAEMGLTSIEHFSGLALAYSRRGGDPLAESLEEPLLDEIAAVLLGYGIHHVPTAAVLHKIQQPEPSDIEDLPGWDVLGPPFQAHWQRLEEAVTRVETEISADLRLWQAMFDRVVSGGAIIGAGSDAPNAPYLVPGVGLHQELAALVTAGLTPSQALQAATYNAAWILGRSDIGALRAGSVADLLIVHGDPSLDIRLSRQVQAVWVGGEAVDTDYAWDRVKEDLEALSGPIWHPAER